MQCFEPSKGFAKLTRNGKRGFCYSVKNAIRVDNRVIPMNVPCGKCQSCYNNVGREWTTKLFHELQYYYSECDYRASFITLTYNDRHMPVYGALDYDVHFTNWLKRLRKHLWSKHKVRIRYFMVGEYGDKNLRPHYHAIIFGYDFPDKYFHELRNDNVIYRSRTIEKYWTVPRGEPLSGESYGYSSVCDVSYAAIAYVAGYNLKKHRNQRGHLYKRVNIFTGEEIDVPTEHHLHSNVPGIGRRWFDRFARTDLMDKGYVHGLNGRKLPSTRYYDRLIEKISPEAIEKIKQSRQDYISSHADEFSPERLKVKKELFELKMADYKRVLGRFGNEVKNIRY